MKQLIINYSEYKKQLLEATEKYGVRDYPFFCLTMGYLLNQIPDFDLLYHTLQQALDMVVKDRLSESEYFQILYFLHEHPERFHDCIAFLEHLQENESADAIQEIEALFSCDRYVKKALVSEMRYNSLDTVQINSQSGSKMFLNEDQQKPAFVQDFDIQIIRKMQEDEQMARKLQQQQEQLMREYKQNAKNEETLCMICDIDLYEGNPSFLDHCGHGFHQECLAETFNFQISVKSFPLKCPREDCKVDCLEGDLKLILSQQLYKKYQENTLKAYADMHGDSISWCPTADCGYMFFYEEGDQVRFQCLECKKQYCLNCRCEWHKDMTCAEYKITNTVSEDDKKFLDFAAGKKYKQCPKCKFWVEKTQGCDHMTCQCKFQFCYKCGGVYMRCQCAQKARQMLQTRMEQRQRARRMKEQRKRQRQRLKKEKASRQKNDQKSQQPRRGRSKKPNNK